MTATSALAAAEAANERLRAENARLRNAETKNEQTLRDLADVLQKKAAGLQAALLSRDHTINRLLRESSAGEMSVGKINSEI